MIIVRFVEEQFAFQSVVLEFSLWADESGPHTVWRLGSPGGGTHTDRDALSLQFCTELNQPILPNIRKWKGPRGCWRAVVADTPSTQLQKVPSSANLSSLLLKHPFPSSQTCNIFLCQHL